MKTCSKCGKDKNVGEFYERSPGVLRKDCKSCVIRRVTESPAEQARKLAAAERKAARIPFDHKTYKAQWYQDNKERLILKGAQWRRDHPNESRAYGRKWQQGNPENGRDTAARHLARKRGNDARQVLQRDLDSLLRRYDHQCAYCHERPFEHWDHIFPLARGGRHAIGNLAPACRPCNQSKSGSLLVEWRKRTRLPV